MPWVAEEESVRGHIHVLGSGGFASSEGKYEDANLLRWEARVDIMGLEIKRVTVTSLSAGHSAFAPGETWSSAADGAASAARAGPYAQEWIHVLVDGEDLPGGHRISLPESWETMLISAFKEHVIDSLGYKVVDLPPASTSLIVHLPNGVPFQATRGLTLKQAYICGGCRVTLRKKPTPPPSPRCECGSFGARSFLHPL